MLSTCQVEACSSRVIHTTVPPYNKTRASSPCVYDFFFFFFPPCEFDFLVNTFAWFRNRGDSFSFCIGKSFPTEKKATCSVVASHCMTKHDLMKFSQRSLLLLLPGLLLRPRLWLQTVYQSRKFCSAQVEREIIEAPVSPCLIQRERSWLFVLPV